MKIFSGDWLVNEGDAAAEPRWRVGYEGEVVNYWSGGVTWKATRSVAERLVRDSQATNVEIPESGRMTLTSDALVTYEPVDDQFYVEQFDAEGFVQVPSWTWYEVDENECDEVVR